MTSLLKIPVSLSLRSIFIFLSAAVFVLLPLLSLDAGISGDEPVHYEHAEYVYNYFQSGGEDQSALNTPVTNLKYYGQVVDNLSFYINKAIDSNRPYLTRHILNSLLGALLILFTGLLAIQLSGYGAGILAVLFMFLSPRILGHSYNNLKDIPFALGYIMSVYGLFLIVRKYPEIKVLPWLWFSLGLALAFGTRAGGLILVPILCLFVFIRWISDTPLKNILTRIQIKNGVYFLILSLLSTISGLFIGIILWPYALESPIRNSLESLSVMTHYSISIRQLFEGEWLWSEHLPWYYPVKYILITTPVVISAGFGLQYFLWRRSKKANLINLIMLNFVIIFPVFWVIVKGSNLYGGWRHLLFVYPAFAAISSASFTVLIKFFKSKYLKLMVSVVLCLGLAGPLLHIIKYHPVEYVYFNKAAGGTDKAFNRYETDYYYHSLGPATKWLRNYLNENEQGKEITVASNFPPGPYFSRDGLISGVYTHYFSRSKLDWDYGIFVNTFLGPDYLGSDSWPPDGSLHEIKIEGRVICSVVKRPSTSDYKGIQLYRQSLFTEAQKELEKALLAEPQNESAGLYLAWTFRQLGDYDRSNEIINRILETHSLSDQAKDLYSRNLISCGDFEASIENSRTIIEQNYKYLPAYEQLSIAADSLGNYELASSTLERAYQLGLRNFENIERLVRYLQEAQYHTKAQKFRTILNKF